MNTFSDNQTMITTFNPDLLMWARVNEGLSRREAVILVNKMMSASGCPASKYITSHMLFRFENGLLKPTLAMLEFFAEAFNRPLGLFLMKDISKLKAKRDASAPHDRNYTKQQPDQ